MINQVTKLLDKKESLHINILKMETLHAERKKDLCLKLAVIFRSFWIKKSFTKNDEQFS